MSADSPAFNLLKAQIEYQFNNPALLSQALTHRSFAANNNERLEFLGDSVLNFIVAHQLYNRFNKLPEGDLSRLRAAL
ncbi:MAG: ribonuclease III, partial [Bdellovibrio sp.]|nr:ribonuclease III [Methylotenera sp.]